MSPQRVETDAEGAVHYRLVCGPEEIESHYEEGEWEAMLAEAACRHAAAFPMGPRFMHCIDCGATWGADEEPSPWDVPL